jgi:hypothetical protein
VAALCGGGLVGLLIYKPQLGLLIPVALRPWRASEGVAGRPRRDRSNIERTPSPRATRAAATDPTLNDRLDDLVFAG